MSELPDHELEFDLVRPAWIKDDCYFLCATIDLRPIPVGVTVDALAHIQRLQGGEFRATELEDDAAIRLAQDAIQRKFKRYGLNAGGAVIVTRHDLTQL